VELLGCEVLRLGMRGALRLLLYASMLQRGTTLSVYINRVIKLLIIVTKQTSKQALNNFKLWF
jgi:hypothetical protein